MTRESSSLFRGPNVLARLKDTEGGALLVLRAFLGITFTYAGLQKLASRTFFNAKAPSSFQAQLHAAMSTSPIKTLLSLAAHAPMAIAVLIALGEIAIGVGTFLGLFARLAALAGLLFSLSFFLTISWTTTPYYYGSDIVFVFAWTPFVVGGAGALSLDALLSRLTVEQAGGDAVDALDSERINRRAALRRLGVLGLVAACTATMTGVVTAIWRVLQSTSQQRPAPALRQSQGTNPPATNTPNGTPIGPAASVPVGGAASFTDPIQQIPAYVVQPVKGEFVAFSAVCTHAGCTVNFDASTRQFQCPCHGSIYDATNGSVLNGPSITPLPRLSITVHHGELYAES